GTAGETPLRSDERSGPVACPLRGPAGARTDRAVPPAPAERPANRPLSPGREEGPGPPASATPNRKPRAPHRAPRSGRHAFGAPRPAAVPGDHLGEGVDERLGQVGPMR